MILIVSSQGDSSTSKVIEWIKSKNKNVEVVRIDDDLGYSVSFKGKDIFVNIHHGNKIIKLDDITAYWYRRGRIRFKYAGNKFFKLGDEEENVLEQYIECKLLDKRSLGGFQTVDPNKLIVLEEATKIGISIPDSYFFESYKDMIDFKDGELITKNYLQTSMFDFSDGTLLIYTNPVKIKSRSNIKFAPSFFQKKIEKLFELRIFYLYGEFYSMAIFSQADKQTSLDFRRYNHKIPNKRVPFSLPQDIEHKLNELMNKLKMDTGSIDMIVSTENEYVFLEVNPIGQFGMVSYPCNYHLEEVIANYLLNEK